MSNEDKIDKKDRKVLSLRSKGLRASFFDPFRANKGQPSMHNKYWEMTNPPAAPRSTTNAIILAGPGAKHK